MTTLHDSKSVATTGSVNTQTSPQSLDRPLVEDGHLVILASWLATLLGSGSLSDILDLTRYTGYGSGSNRLGGVYLGVVADAAAFNAAADFILKATSSTATTRVAGIVASYPPDAGKHWDLSSAVAAGPEYNTATQTSDTYPAIAARTDTFGVAMTNKGASTSLTRHVVPDGTLLIQARSNSAATNENPGGSPPTANTVSVSDSVVSIARIPSGGGATVNFVAQAADGSSSATALSQASGACIAFTVAINQVDDTPDPDPLPAVTGQGFGTIRKMLQTRHSVWSHRNGGLGTSGSSPANGYPEMTEYGVRMAANAGASIIEISCQRTSDEQWIGAHDQTFDRVTQETTYDGQNYSARTAAEILALHVNAGATGGPQPYATLQQLVETLPEDFVFLVDPKQAGGTPSYLTAFLNILDSLGGPERFIVKIDGAATASRFQAVKDHNPSNPYVTAAYWYDTTTNFATSIPPKLPYVDLAGLNIEPNEAAASYWTDLRAMCNAQTAIDGKQRYIWAHVVQSQAGHDLAIARGADFIQCSNVAVTQKGVEAWRPILGPDGFAVKEIYAGSALAQKVYVGDELVWVRS